MVFIKEWILFYVYLYSTFYLVLLAKIYQYFKCTNKTFNLPLMRMRRPVELKKFCYYPNTFLYQNLALMVCNGNGMPPHFPLVVYIPFYNNT